MKKLINSIKVKREIIEKILFWLIVFGAAYFRFRGLGELPFFTYDQARDALFIKRIVVDHQHRLTGPQASIPGLYTGSFYYYLMAPFLALFRFNPVGIDFGIVVFGLLSIGLFFKILKELTKRPFFSLLITALFAFSPQVITQSRFGWNPNPLPLFTLLFLLSLKRIIFDQKENWLPVLGFSLGAAINHHYSSLGLLFALFWLWLVFRPKFKQPRLVIGFFLAFFLFLLPTLLFDLRHGFINTRNILRYFVRGVPGKIPPPILPGLWQKISDLLRLVFNLPFFWQNLLVTSVLVLGGWLLLKERKEGKTFFTVVWLVFLSGILFASFYRGSFFSFYLTFLYPLPYLMVGLLFEKLFDRFRGAKIITFLILGLALIGNLKQVWPMGAPQRTIDDLSLVAQSLAEKIKPGEKFNLVALHKDRVNFDNNAVDYRYFLEAKYGVSVPGWDVLDYQQAETIYLINEAGQVEPLTLDIWELGLFGPKQVASSWEVGQDVVIYKLER